MTRSVEGLSVHPGGECWRLGLDDAAWGVAGVEEVVARPPLPPRRVLQTPPPIHVAHLQIQKFRSAPFRKYFFMYETAGRKPKERRRHQHGAHQVVAQEQQHLVDVDVLDDVPETLHHVLDRLLAQSLHFYLTYYLMFFGYKTTGADSGKMIPDLDLTGAKQP